MGIVRTLSVLLCYSFSFNVGIWFHWGLQMLSFRHMKRIQPILPKVSWTGSNSKLVVYITAPENGDRENRWPLLMSCRSTLKADTCSAQMPASTSFNGRSQQHTRDQHIRGNGRRRSATDSVHPCLSADNMPRSFLRASNSCCKTISKRFTSMLSWHSNQAFGKLIYVQCSQEPVTGQPKWT